MYGHVWYRCTHLTVSKEKGATNAVEQKGRTKSNKQTMKIRITMKSWSSQIITKNESKQYFTVISSTEEKKTCALSYIFHLFCFSNGNFIYKMNLQKDP